MSYPAKELYSIHDAGRNLDHTGREFLSIELSLDGFSYCVLDTDSFRYVLLESFAIANNTDYALLADVIVESGKSKNILNRDYQRVSISLISQLITFIPADLYTFSEKGDYIDFNVRPDAAHEIKVDKLNNLGAYAIYPYPRVLLQKIDKLFPNARIRHAATSLVENLIYMARYSQVKMQLVLHVQANHFEIVIFDQDKLSFYNSFRYQTVDDLFYYLFFVLEHLGLQAENLDTLLYGEVGINSEFYKKIKLYVKSLNFGPRNDLYKYCDAFDNIPHHYFYNLLNLNVCG